MTTKDYMSFEKTWEHGLITGYFTNWFNVSNNLHLIIPQTERYLNLDSVCMALPFHAVQFPQLRAYSMAAIGALT